MSRALSLALAFSAVGAAALLIQQYAKLSVGTTTVAGSKITGPPEPMLQLPVNPPLPGPSYVFGRPADTAIPLYYAPAAPTPKKPYGNTLAVGGGTVLTVPFGMDERHYYCVNKQTLVLVQCGERSVTEDKP